MIWIVFSFKKIVQNRANIEISIFVKNVQFVLTGTLTPSNVDLEEAEIEMCARHKRYFEETKATGTSAWCLKHHLKGQVDVKQDICLFKARYSSRLKLKFTCDGCSKKIGGSWYRCLNCIDVNLCTNCYNSGKKPSDHLNSHEIIELRLVKAALNF